MEQAPRMVSVPKSAVMVKVVCRRGEQLAFEAFRRKGAKEVLPIHQSLSIAQ